MIGSPALPAAAASDGRTALVRLRRYVLIIAGLVAWEIVARSGRVNPILFPSLVKILGEFGALLVHGDRLVEAWYSLYRALGGFALAAAVGVPLGMVMGRSAAVGNLLEPLFSGTYPVPKIALFPVFVFIFGIGSLSKIALVFLECLYPIVINAAAGARGVDRALLWSARNMGASRAQALRRVVVPATAPYLFAGFRVALPIALIVVIITEMIGSADGLGYFVMYNFSSFRTDRVLAAVLAIALLGLGLDRGLVAARSRLIFWEKLETYYA
jgi:ABC-type nitrate/sulfonate/bicarbonate transport system permease component